MEATVGWVNCTDSLSILVVVFLIVDLKLLINKLFLILILEFNLTILLLEQICPTRQGFEQPA